MAEHCEKERKHEPTSEAAYLDWHYDQHSSLYACNLDQIEYVATGWGWRPAAFIEITGENLYVELEHGKLQRKTWERLDPNGTGTSSKQMEMQWWIAQQLGIPMYVVIYDLRKPEQRRFAVRAFPDSGEWVVMEEERYVRFLKKIHRRAEKKWERLAMEADADKDFWPANGGVNR
jgi:hypothetical protein